MADDFEKLRDLHDTLDTGDMLGLVSGFPKQMEDAWQRGAAFAADLKPSQAGSIVVCGMGGSAIGGDMVRSYLGDGLRAPLYVNRRYDVPAALQKNAFFVFSSYSGDTGETLAAYRAVRASGARAVAITSGGELGRLCHEDGVPVCEIPGGMPPRAAIAYSFFPLLHILRASALADVAVDEFEEARAGLVSLCNDLTQDSAHNRAAELAGKINGRLPLIYSGGGLMEAVARRWSTQFNENSKILAHYGTFSEINHNEIVGWTALESVRSQLVVVSLEDTDDHAMVKSQMNIAREIIEPNCAGVIRISDLPGNRLQRILSAMILGDFTSVYLAYLNGVDPTPVANIDLLKERLKKERARGAVAPRSERS